MTTQNNDPKIPLEAQALSIAIAERAAQSPFVVGFRENYLSDGLLKPESVCDWLDAIRERGAHKMKHVPHDSEQKWMTIQYPRPGHMSLGLWKVAPGGVLRSLWTAADQLSRRFRLEQSEAIKFILTGQRPTPIMNKCDVQDSAVPRLATITLTIDPNSTPDTVRRLYGEARARIANRRAREMKPGSLEQFIFWKTHATDPSTGAARPWKELCLMWDADRASRGKDGTISRERSLRERYLGDWRKFQSRCREIERDLLMLDAQGTREWGSVAFTPGEI